MANSSTNKDREWFEAHHEELLERYPEQWVAIYDQQVITNSPDARDLFVDLKEKSPAPGHELIEYLTKEEQMFILSGTSVWH